MFAQQFLTAANPITDGGIGGDGCAPRSNRLRRRVLERRCCWRAQDAIITRQRQVVAKIKLCCSERSQWDGLERGGCWVWVSIVVSLILACIHLIRSDFQHAYRSACQACGHCGLITTVGRLRRQPAITTSRGCCPTPCLRREGSERQRQRKW